MTALAIIKLGTERTAAMPSKPMRRSLNCMKRVGGGRTRAKLAGRSVRIWSDEHGAFWRPDRAGYTAFRKAAGVYLFGDAWEATAHCGPEKKIWFEVVS